MIRGELIDSEELAFYNECKHLIRTNPEENVRSIDENDIWNLKVSTGSILSISRRYEIFDGVRKEILKS